MITEEGLIFVGFFDIGKRHRRARRFRVDFLSHAAHIEFFGIAPRHDIGIAIDEFAVEDDSRNVLNLGIDNCTVEVFAVFFIDGDIGDFSGFQIAQDVFEAQGDGAIIRRSHPQIVIGERSIEIIRIEEIGALELAEHVHRARINPVGAQGNRHAHVVVEGDARRIAIERNIGARRPDELDIFLSHRRDDLGYRCDAVDDGEFRVEDVFGAIAVATEATQFVERRLANAFADMRHVFAWFQLIAILRTPRIDHESATITKRERIVRRIGVPIDGIWFIEISREPLDIATTEDRRRARK